MDVGKMLEALTVEEKIALVSGKDFMFTNGVPRLGIPSVSMADGPHGLRKQTAARDNGIAESEPATAFPTAACTASGWNEENLYKMGRAIAEECLYYGVDVLLGPGVNIKRNPLCGRSFEYFSEDPYLAGKLGAAMIRGVQERGVATSVKHFALNNSENYRFMGDSIADERAMREIYLKPFEIAVKEGKPDTVMCAYNKVGGVYCSENLRLLNDVLRREWGFRGAVMTDWGATHDRVESLRAGVDIEMPGDTKICRSRLYSAVSDGALDTEILDQAAGRVLKLAGDALKREKCRVDFDEHHRLAGEIAEDCAVLMKNDGALPLSLEDRLCVVGELFEKMRYQGSGSSMINSTRITTPRAAFDERGVKYTYYKGYGVGSSRDGGELLEEACNAAAEADKIIVFAGLTDHSESEGCDRENMRLPENQLAVISALAGLGKPVVVVLYGGSAVELPFNENVNAILNMLLPGQNGGEATARLVFGEANPSGRLAESWPMTYSDVLFGNEYSQRQEVYRESIFVGYRYYSTAKKRVRYPFGHGLSYTRFEYSNMTVRRVGENVEVSVDVKNVGERYGGEVVQLYVGAPKGKVFAPCCELHGFKKLYLLPDETKNVNITLQKCDFSYYNTLEKRYAVLGGDYEISFRSSAAEAVLSHSIYIDGDGAVSPYSDDVLAAYSGDLSLVTNEIFEKMSGLHIPALPPVLPITMDSRFSDLKATFMGRLIYRGVMIMPNSHRRRAMRLPEGAQRDNMLKGAEFLRRVLDSESLISMSMSSGGVFGYNLAEGMMYIANGRIFKGFLTMLKPISAPPLPKQDKLV